MNKKLKLIILSFFVILLTYKYYRTKIFIFNIKEDSNKIKHLLIEDYRNFADEFPKTKIEFDSILFRHKDNLNLKSSFFKNGYNVKYDSINKLLIVYSFGYDSKDNHLKKIPFNTLDSKGVTVSIRFSLLSFLNSYNSDVIVMNIKELNNFDFCEIKTLKNLRDIKLRDQFITILKISKNNSTLDRASIKKFMEELKKIEFKINYNKIKEEKDKILFFRYKDKKIKVICNNDLNDINIDKYISFLESEFSKMDKSYFDYAVFPLNIGSGDLTPAPASL